MKYICLFALVLFSMASCNNHEALREIPVDTSCPLLDEYLLSEVSAERVSEIIDSFIIVPLEESEASLLGNIDAIRRANGKFYIQSNDRMYLFDNDGKFIKTFAEKGQGPDEVLELMDFDVNGEELVIMDHSKFLWYDTDGNPIKSTPNPYGFGRLRLTGGGEMLMRTVVPLDNNGHIIVMLDNKGDTVFTALEQYYCDIPRHRDFSKLNDSVFIHPMYSAGGNEIFMINTSERRGKIVPTATFGNPMSAIDNYEYRHKVGRPIDTPELTFVGWTDNSESLLLPAFKRGKVYAFIYDKATRETIKIDVDELKDDMLDGQEDAIRDFFLWLNEWTSDDEYFVGIIDSPKQVYDRKDELCSRFAKEYEKLSDAREDSNPALVLVKFKRALK